MHFFSARHPNSPSQPDANISAFEPKFPDVSSKTRIPAQRRSRSSGKTELEEIICYKYIYFVLYRDGRSLHRLQDEKISIFLQIFKINHLGAGKQDKKDKLWYETFSCFKKLSRQNNCFLILILLRR